MIGSSLQELHDQSTDMEKTLAHQGIPLAQRQAQD